MSVPTRDIVRPLFGKPTLEAGGNGRVSWVAGPVASDDHVVAWAAKLDAGVQTSWNDFAKVVIPVNEMPFADLESVRLMPYYTASTGIDMGVCLYLHDPEDLDQRIELSHTPLTNSAAGWRELNWPTDIPAGHAYFWYGDETKIAEVLSEDTAYTLAQFRADTVFRGWTIYKITLDYGYYTGGGTMDGCYLAQVFINGKSILLEPSEEVAGRETKSIYKATASDSSTKATLVTPTKRIRVIAVFMAGGATGANYEMYFGAGANMAASTTKAIALAHLDTAKMGSVAIPFGKDGPLGGVAEVVSIRTSTNVTTEGAFVMIYREE